MVERFRDGATIAQVAVELGRGTGGVRARLRKLGPIDL